MQKQNKIMTSKSQQTKQAHTKFEDEQEEGKS